MNRILLLLLLFFYTSLSFSQSKGVFVSNYNFKNNAEKWCWAITQDGNKNMLFGVSKGVIVSDGLNERFVKTSFTPSLMEYDSVNNKVWVAGYNQIGVLTSGGEEKSYRFANVEKVTDQEFHSIEILNDTVYIVSNDVIVTIDSKSDNIINTIESDYGDITNLILFNNKVYLIIDYFLFELKNNELIELENIDWPVDEFTYSLSKDAKLILGTVSSTFYSFNGKNFRTREFKKSKFFKQNIIFDAQVYSDSLVVMSSITGGIGIVDINRNRVVKQIDYFNGLPDDEIRTMFVDNDKGIWVSHGFGVSRIDLKAGIEEFTFFPGLKGNPIALSYFQDKLYVASTDGLFVLENVKDYAETQYRVRYQETQLVTSIPEENTDKEEVEISTEEKAKGRKQRRRNKRKNTEEVIEQPKRVNPQPTIRTKIVDKYKTVKKRRLKSISKIYTQIDGVGDGKVKQLLPYGNFLLAAGNKGLYAISNKNAEKLIKDVYVNSIYYNSELNQLFCCTDNGLYKISRNGKKWDITHFYKSTSENVYSIVNHKDGNWVITIENKVIKAKLKGNEILISNEIDMPEEPGEVFFVKNIDNEISIFTTTFIYGINSNNDLEIKEELPDDSYLLDNQPLYTFINKDNTWELRTNQEVKPSENAINKILLNNKIRYINVNDLGDIWLINEDNQIVKILGSNKIESDKFVAEIKCIKNNDNYFDIGKSISLPAKASNINVKLTAPFYLVQKGVLYSYKVFGFDNDWSEWSDKTSVNIKYLPPGKYTLQIKAKNALGNETKTSTIVIVIDKPFTQTIVFYLLLIVLFIAFAIIFSKMRLKKLEKDKRVLETKVKERTQTIELQKDRIEKQHSEITQSIRYAQRIQRAMLPLNEIMEAMLPNHFVLFMPRDIVSGDFYFFKPFGKYVILVAADCTGHGVPGGFMSMLGISYLSEITSQLSEDSTAAQIINHLRDKIKLTLGQTSIESKQKDGMDLTICLINIDEKKIQFAGAFNPLFILRNNELITVKGDRQPVSVYYNEIEFTNHEIEVQEGDKFYMFSDGYPDQIGGPRERKFMSKKFKQLILDNHKKPMIEQKEILHKTIEKWRGDLPQVDDILVVGFEILPND